MSKRVLLVDDDESTLQVVTAILKMNGYEVITLSDCQDIVENVEKYMPSLVLMDIWMPGAGGEYAAKELKNNSATSGIPVVLFSGEEDILLTMDRVGAEGAIAKPFDMIQFASTVGQYMA
jgi:DNA-binding NtrC family response regulator